MSDVTGFLIGIGPMLALLLWCNLRDRRAFEANGVRADITSAANRILGGESLLAIRVEPSMSWRRGRVHLSTPGGYEFLITSVTGAVIRRMPRDYELVVHRPPARPAPQPARRTAKRILMVLTRSLRADYTAAARFTGLLARESGGTVRLAYVGPLPPPRVDRHDRVVADTDREMARIAAEASELLKVLTAELEGVPVEHAVRFGRLGAEVRIEAEVFGADLVALAGPPRPGLRDRIRAWWLGRAALGSRVPVILLPPTSGPGRDGPERVASASQLSSRRAAH